MSIGDALLAGAVAGLGQMAMQDQKRKDEEFAREAAIAKENYERRMAAWKVSLEPPKYQTFDDEQDGARGKRTVKSIPQADGTWVEQDLGWAPEAPKPPTSRTIRQGGDEVTQEFDAATGAWNEIGRGPRWNPDRGGSGGEGGDGKATGSMRDFEYYASLSPEQRAIYDRMKGRTDPEDDEKKNERWARTQTALQLRDFNKLDRYGKKEMYRNAGIDPDAPDAFDQYKRMLRDDNLTAAGVSLFKKVQGGAESTAAATGGAPGKAGSSPNNPAPASAFTSEPPPGTWVKLPDGRVIQTR